MIGDIETKGNLAYIDISHGERFNIDHHQDNSVAGLMFHLNAYGALPLLLRDFSKEDIENSKILIFNAPTECFNDDEINFIKNYMSNGGIVFLCTGYDDKEASMPLLNEFGLDIDNFPLGKVDYEGGFTDTIFVDGWPINIKDASSTESFYNITISGFTYKLVTFTSYGNGGLLLISDSQFLLNNNLQYNQGNIRFLVSILDLLYGRGMLK
jgi:hypothetical protein